MITVVMFISSFCDPTYKIERSVVPPPSNLVQADQLGFSTQQILQSHDTQTSNPTNAFARTNLIRESLEVARMNPI